MSRLQQLCVTVFTLWTISAPGQESLNPGKPMKPGKPVPAPVTGKPAAKLVEEPREARDPKPPSAAIDRWVDAGLGRAGVQASPPADDGEFLRRVTLDLIGRIPTHAETAAFLESSDPDKRSRWINSLLA